MLRAAELGRACLHSLVEGFAQQGVCHVGQTHRCTPAPALELLQGQAAPCHTKPCHTYINTAVMAGHMHRGMDVAMATVTPVQLT